MAGLSRIGFCAALLFTGVAVAVSQTTEDTAKFAEVLLVAESPTALLDRQPQLITNQLLEALRAKAQALQKQRKPDRALAAYEVALEVAGRLEAPQYGASVVDVGVAFILQNRYAEAVRRMEAGLATLRSRTTREPRNTAVLLGAIGSAYRLLGEPRHALRYFEEALAVPDRQTVPKWDASILMRIGAACVSLHEEDKALLALRNARAMFGLAKDDQGLSATAREIGRLQSNQGNAMEARATLLQAVEHAHRSGEAFEQAAACMSLGEHLRNLGDRAGAIKYLEQALLYLSPEGDPIPVAQTLCSIGEVYLTQNDLRQAERYALRAQKTLANRNLRDTVLVHVSELLGKVANDRNREREALVHFERALGEARRVENRASEGRLLGLIASCHYGLKDVDRAIANGEQALAIRRELGNPADVCSDLLGLGYYYMDKRLFDRALSLQQEALDAAQQSGLLHFIQSSHSAMAETYEEMGMTEEAIDCYRKACEPIPFILSGIAGGPRSKQLGMEPFADDYSRLIALLAQRGLAAEALRYAEEVKARTLVTLLQSGRIDFLQRLTPNERMRYMRAEERVAGLGRRALTERDPAAQERVRRDLDDARLELEGLETSLYSAHPELQATAAFNPVKAEDALKMATPGGPIVEFAVCAEGVAVLALSSDRQIISSIWIKVERRELTKLVAQVRTDIGQHRLDFRASSAKLYDLIFRPLRSILPATGPLLLIPDGPLWDLPFQALLQPNGRFLIESYDIAYAPSISALQAMLRLPTGRAGARSTLFAVGNPSLGVKGSGPVKRTVRGVALQPLPEAEAEVRSLAGLYGRSNSAVSIGSAATETSVRRAMPEYRILHFATHGILDNATPFYSCLVLAPSGSKEDGLLQAWEVTHLRLKADLAVLAGCETARGRVSAGEGNVGLCWSFFAAGCPTTLVSQWKVDSKFTSALMLQFHRAFSGGGSQSPSLALRDAARLLMKDPKYRHPFYWASFVVMGANRPLR